MAQNDSSTVAGNSVMNSLEHRLAGDDRRAEIAVQHLPEIVADTARQIGRSKPNWAISSAWRSGDHATLAGHQSGSGRRAPAG